MLRIVMTREELDSLSPTALVLTTDGDPWTRVHGKYCWSRPSNIPRTSAQMADGRPILVLWDPASPEILLSLWVTAMGTLAPQKMDSIDVVYRELAEPGANVFYRMLERDREDELEALAVVDFVNCWARRTS